jgi:hypothetical protein
MQYAIAWRLTGLYSTLIADCVLIIRLYLHIGTETADFLCREGAVL